jgi:hypothetical protein
MKKNQLHFKCRKEKQLTPSCAEAWKFQCYVLDIMHVPNLRSWFEGKCRCLIYAIPRFQSPTWHLEFNITTPTKCWTLIYFISCYI